MSRGRPPRRNRSTVRPGDSRFSEPPTAVSTLDPELAAKALETGHHPSDVSTSGGFHIEYERPYLYDLQMQAFFCDERYSLCEASTKSGKTHGCMVWIFERCLFSKPGHWHWWVAPVLGQARIAYERMKRALAPYGERLIHTNDSRMEIHIVGAGSIAFKSAENPDNLYGEDVYSMVTDEASRCKLEAFFAMRSTLTFTEGLWRLIGNVKGRKNEFYRMCMLAKANEPGFRYTKITAYDAVAAGVLRAVEIEDAKRLLPEGVFRELYLAEPGEDGGNPFGYDHIRACIQPDWYKPSLDPVTHYPLGAESIGIDLAKSKDWTTIIALDDAGNTIYYDKFRMDWLATVDRLANDVINLRPSGAVLVDSTGVGDPVLENIQAAIPGHNVSGFKLSNQSKQQIMEGLAVALQQRELSIPDGDIVDELDSYEYAYTPSGLVRYTAPEGYHDDLVVALALANRARTEEVTSWDW